MEREHVESSMIASIGYEPSESLLEIEFKSGGRPIWQYTDVPEHVYHDMKSGSLGKYFLANIRGQYPETRVG